MERRKIQLIAGTTYSVSLPKEWVRQNKLKEQSEVTISMKNDRTLLISSVALSERTLNEIAINVDDYPEVIDRVLFSVYYLGIETITVFSKTRLTKDAKVKIRKTIAHMSGTEISYEDEQRISIKVLLDKSKVDVLQLLYRVSLILDLSFTSIMEGDIDLNEIIMNENEIDRLYHLLSKIVSSSLIDAQLLRTSKIKNISLIPAYFLISKKLENIGDSVYHLAEHIASDKATLEHRKEILSFIKQELAHCMRHIMSESAKNPEKPANLKKVHEYIAGIRDHATSDHIRQIMRYVIDIEEETFNISFCNKLIAEGVL